MNRRARWSSRARARHRRDTCGAPHRKCPPCSTVERGKIRGGRNEKPRLFVRGGRRPVVRRNGTGAPRPRVAGPGRALCGSAGRDKHPRCRRRRAGCVPPPASRLPICLRRVRYTSAVSGAGRSSRRWNHPVINAVRAVGGLEPRITAQVVRAALTRGPYTACR